MTTFRVATVHAFNRGELKGGPAGVCVLDAFPDDAAMQEVARRMGYPETSFLVKRDDRHYDLRWFSPTQEIPLCGHATVAATHWLNEAQVLDHALPSVTFFTKSGPIEVITRSTGKYTLTLPTTQPQNVADTAHLQACLGVPITACKRSDASYLVEVKDMQALRNCQPRLDAIAKLDSEDLIVTARADNGYDYAYRCFCPQVGIPEDQVTGSANCLLAPYWHEKLGHLHLKALQASPNGGALDVHYKGSTVDLLGNAITTQKPVTIDLDKPRSERQHA